MLVAFDFPLSPFSVFGFHSYNDDVFGISTLFLEEQRTKKLLQRCLSTLERKSRQFSINLNIKSNFLIALLQSAVEEKRWKMGRRKETFSCPAERKSSVDTKTVPENAIGRSTAGFSEFVHLLREERGRMRRERRLGSKSLHQPSYIIQMPHP